MERILFDGDLGEKDGVYGTYYVIKGKDVEVYLGSEILTKYDQDGEALINNYCTSLDVNGKTVLIEKSKEETPNMYIVNDNELEWSNV